MYIDGAGPVPMLFLEHVDLDALSPKPHVVRIVASLVSRCGDPAKPGVVALPNLLNLFPQIRRQHERVFIGQSFQYSLMKKLLNFLKKERPEVLVPQAYLELPEKEAQKHYERAKPGIKVLSIEGMHSYKTLHMDALQHVVISFCHHPRRNVHGGLPLFLDLLQTFGVKHAAHVTHTVPGNAIYHPKERAVLLDPNYHERARKHVGRLTALDYTKFPIVIASNRIEDGIMHGATQVRKPDPTKRSSRHISYVAIKCN